MESEGGIIAHRVRKQRTGKGAGLYNLKLSHSNLLPLVRLQLQKCLYPSKTASPDVFDHFGQIH